MMAAAFAPKAAQSDNTSVVAESFLRSAPQVTQDAVGEAAGAPVAPHAVAARSDDDPVSYSAIGLASWYGSQFHGRPTANGETFDRAALTAAHPSLPLPCYVRVTNLDNSRSVIVRVNDRGPYSHDRLIDVSEETADILAFRRHGTTHVRVDYVARAPLHTDDNAMLLASYRGPSPRVTLASAEPRKPAATSAVAFADDGQARAAAMDRLTQPYSAVDRILMAFDAASTAED